MNFNPNVLMQPPMLKHQHARMRCDKCGRAFWYNILDYIPVTCPWGCDRKVQAVMK